MSQFDIKNLDQKKEKEAPRDPLTPDQPVGLLFSGQTKSGKTMALANMLLDGFLTYDKLYVFTSHPEQEKYKMLRTFFSELESDPALSDLIDKPIMTIQDSLKALPAPEQLDKRFRSVMIFDDLLMEPKKDQEKMMKYFIAGRHGNCSPIYLTQSYHDTPGIIRKNANVLLFYEPPNERELQEFARTHASDVSGQTFKEMFKTATGEKFNFFYVDKTSPKHLKYRKNLTEIFDPDWIKEHEDAVAEEKAPKRRRK